ncbi:hypothetical protein GJ496_003918 [Pomphorhynchus laevis]|nr:hypothetical protein GJ496_003918 [Pomphorhynchus laevis]
MYVHCRSTLSSVPSLPPLTDCYSIEKWNVCRSQVSVSETETSPCRFASTTNAAALPSEPTTFCLLRDMQSRKASNKQ